MIAPKLSQACYTVRKAKQYWSRDALKTIYYAFFFTQLWLMDWFSEKILHSESHLQITKRSHWYNNGARTRDSCSDLFKVLKMLPLLSQYIFSLAMSVVNNKGLFMENSELYNVDPRNKCNLYQPSSHLMTYQKGPYCTDIKVYNFLPAQTKTLSWNIKQFKTAFMNFLQIHSCFTLSKYFNCNKY